MPSTSPITITRRLAGVKMAAKPPMRWWKASTSDPDQAHEPDRHVAERANPQRQRDVCDAHEHHHERERSRDREEPREHRPPQAAHDGKDEEEQHRGEEEADE